jgi:predicted nucleic acid-binding protein
LILDTDHCVAILRGRQRLDEKIAPDMPLFITAITVSELIYGAYRSQRVGENIGHINLLVQSVAVLPFDETTARRCSELKELLRRDGQTLGEPDLQIASIALSHSLPLVTHNTAHFNRIPGLVLLDWLN